MSEVNTTQSPEIGSKRTILLLFGTLMIVMLLSSLSQMVLSSALPTIVGELHGVEHMMWIITAFMLASTIMMPIYGKISDLVGRKPLLVVAVVIFLAGSVLGGSAQDMNTLIAARVIQGLGGGGLMILSQAAIADVVPARERGKYMGIMGGVFAFSSVAGPLIGGWLTEGPGWRWAFWMNVPLGILAVIATIALMPSAHIKSENRPKVDYVGMALLALGTTTLILIGTWAGSTYAWGSPEIIGLAITTVIAGTAFVFVESRVKEPIMPLELFKDRNFNLTTIAGLLIAVSMFGTTGYIPTYFQMALGASASTAGLLMIPMMAALLITSVIAGAIISKTGKYKKLPISGAVIVAIGLSLLATVTISTPTYIICSYLGVLGVGLGMNMQILTLIVQNSFPHNVVGTATAGNNFFRQVGGSLGSAVVGSLFVGRLTTLVADKLPEGTGPTDGAASLTPDLVNSLPEPIRLIIVESYNEALIPIFIYMVPMALMTAVLLCFVKEIPLATTIDREAVTASLKQSAEASAAIAEGEADIVTTSATNNAENPATLDK